MQTLHITKSQVSAHQYYNLLSYTKLIKLFIPLKFIIPLFHFLLDILFVLLESVLQCYLRINIMLSLLLNITNLLVLFKCHVPQDKHNVKSHVEFFLIYLLSTG